MHSLLLSDRIVGRRAMLKSAGGLAVAAVIGGARAATLPETRLGEDGGIDRATALYAFGKIWSGYDAPVIGAFHGTMYLRAGDKRAVPVFGFAGIGTSQSRLDDSGVLTMKSRETGYFTDLATGDVLEQWDNPFTGQRVDVYHFYDDVLRGHLKAGDLTSSVSFAPLGSDQLMMSWDYAGEKENPVTPKGWPSYSTGRRISASEHFTLYVGKNDVLDRSVPSVLSRGSFSRMSQCWPFMKMGKSPLKDATLFGRMFTHKGLPGYGEVPRKILDYAEKHAPLYLEVPPGWGEAGEIAMKRLDTWQAFAQDIPPETAGYTWEQQKLAPGLAPPSGMAAKYRI